MAVPESLKEALRAGHCVPFVGAGVSMAVRNKSFAPLFPSWNGLLNKCADRLQNENKPNEAQLVRAALGVGEPDYLYAAKKARDFLGPIWYKVLAAELDPSISEVDRKSLELARAVWELGSKLIITTNFDRTLQWAAPDNSDLQTWEIEARSSMAGAFDKITRPTVWHLHGHIQNPTKLVLTPDGYELLYGSHATESSYQAAVQTLRQAMTSRTLLFIGFSGDDSHIAAQLKRIDEIFSGTAGPHYILEREGGAKNLNGLNLPLESVKFSDFGDPLLALLGKLKSYTTSGKVELADTTIVALHERASQPVAQGPAASVKRRMGDLTSVKEYDAGLVNTYRSQLRLDAQDLYPRTLTDEQFLEKAGYLRNGFLTVGGVLLFSASPCGAAPDELGSAIVQCVVYGGTTKSAERTRARFAGAIISQIVEARDFIAKNIKWVELPAEHTMQSVLEYEYPMICVREMIANALCHRDYNDGDRMTHIRIFSDRIEISSPGIWHGARPVGTGSQTVDKFRGESIQRNMHLAHGVSMVSIVEMEGSGIPTSIYNCEARDSPLPTVLESDGFVQITIYPRRTWESKVVQGRVFSRVSPDIEMLQQLLSASVSRGDRAGQVDHLIKLASTYLGIRAYEEALEFAQRAIEIGEDLGLTKDVTQARFVSIKAEMMLRRSKT
jgi:hypothetical protein